MTPTTTLTGATLPDGRVRNVVLRSGCVSHLRPVGPPEPGSSVVDLTGYVLLPAPAEPHLHLDRALAWEAVGATTGSAAGRAPTAWRLAPARFTTPDLRRRARTTLQTLAAHGATAVRAHLDVGGPNGTPLRAVEVLRELREDLARVIDVQITAAASPDLGERGVLDAMNAGANFVGGSPHRAGDVRAENRRLLRLADRADADLDLHLDEVPHPRVLAVGDLARVLRSSGFAHRVTAGHVAGLSLLAPGALAHVAEAIAASGMSVVTLPPLTARSALPAAPLRALLRAGVPVAAGGDHLRDAAHPTGLADPLRTASLLAAWAGLTPDQAYAAVSTSARAVMGLPPAGPEAGAVADLLAVRAGSLAEVVADAPAERIVLRRGRVVSRTAPARIGSLQRPVPGRPIPAQRGSRVPVGMR